MKGKKLKARNAESRVQRDRDRHLSINYLRNNTHESINIIPTERIDRCPVLQRATRVVNTTNRQRIHALLDIPPNGHLCTR